MEPFVSENPIHSDNDAKSLDPISLSRLGRLIVISIAAQILLLLFVGPWVVLCFGALCIAALFAVAAFRSTEEPPEVVDTHS